MKNTKDNEREIADFERNFKREFFKKIPKHNIYNQTLDALFKVFKEINLYDYFSLGRLMDVITTLNIKYLPTEVLHEMNGEAIYEIFTNTIMINDKFLNKPKYIEDFIHELTHSISAFYKISNEKNNFISNKYKYFDYHNGNEESLGIFPIAITKIDLEKDEEINNYINTMDYKLCKDLYKKYTSYNEGVTEVFTMLVKSKFIRSRLNYAVVIHVKVAEMFCKIFGNKVWESYFTNSFKPILEKLNIPPENIMEIISSLDNYDKFSLDKYGNFKNIAKEYVDNVTQMQFKLLYLFENKMKIETKKYSENFYGSNNCKKAILYNFQKFSESFYFDEVFTDGISMTLQQKLWKEFLTVVKRSIEYVDQVIYQTEKPLNIDYIKYVEYCHEQTCKNYDYITTDGKDLTLKDKMIFEKNKHENILKKSMSKPHFSYDYIANR